MIEFKKVVRKLIFGIMGITGWALLVFLIWDIMLKGGVVYWDANHFGELWIEFILINCIFIFLIILLIYELKEIFNEKRKTN